MTQRFSLLIIAALLLCLLMIPTAQAESGAVLTLTPSASTGYGGEEITLSISLTAENLGGLQAILSWNEGYLTYVEGSAAFSEAFTENAATSMVNANTASQLTLVYGNINGYAAEEEVIFTARFLLNEDVSGDTTFTLSGVKATDASASLSALTVEANTATVTTQIFDAGSMYMDVKLSNSSPRIGETFTVTLALSSSTDTVGSIQGTFKYDPAVIRYVDGSAAFTQEASSAALTKMVNTATAGEVRFVYAAMNGFTGSDLVTMEFEVVGGVNNSYRLVISDLKATNTSTDHLALMNTSCYANYLYPQGEPDTVYLTANWQGATYSYYDTVVTIAVRADGMAFGGMQAILHYNADQLTYVPGSAAFSSEFRENATISMVNEATAGQLRMIYTSAEGYTPDGSDIFTAQFVVKHIGRLDNATLSDLKLTNASADLATVPASGLSDGYMYGYRGSYDMSGVNWDYSTDFTWDGTEKTILLTGLPEGLTPIYSNNTATEPGNYVARVTFEYDTEHYYDPGSRSCSWVINRATYDMSNVAWEDTRVHEWDGTEKMVYLSGLPEGVTPVYSNNTATEPGTYYVSVTFEYDTAHYNAPSFDGTYWNIYKASFDMSGVTWDYTKPRIWDGTVQTVQLLNLPEGLTASYSGNTATTPGTYYANVTFTCDTTYYVTPKIGTLIWEIIQLKDYDMSGVSWDYTDAFIWDGTEKSVTLTGLPEGITPIYSGNAATDIGDYTASVTFEYDAENYYEPVVAPLDWSIIARRVYDMSGVNWDYTGAFVWDGTEKAVALTGLPDGVTPVYTSCTATEPGEYIASVTFEYNTAEYEAPVFEDLVWQISKATFDMSGTAWDYTDAFVWDGTEKTVALTGLPEGVTPVYSGNAATEPGTYTASAAFGYDDVHYEAPVVDDISWEITKATFDMSGVTWDYTDAFVWDGTEKAVTLTGLPEGVTPVYSGNAATEPGTYTASAAFRYDDVHYESPVVDDISWEIIKATFDMSGVTWECIAFIWDGTEKTVVLTGLPEGLFPTYSGHTATDVGSYTATVTFEYDTAHYEEPARQWTYWYIDPAPAEGLQANPSKVVLTLEHPWNMFFVEFEFLPTGSAEEFLIHGADETIIMGTEWGGWVQALSVGTSYLYASTEDGRLSASCEVEVVESLRTSTLPHGLTVVEKEAFCGATSLELVILPDTLTTLESRAFADSGLLFIQIPASVTSIAPDVFDGSRLQTIYTPEGSTAATFAAEHGIYCVTY